MLKIHRGSETLYYSPERGTITTRDFCCPIDDFSVEARWVVKTKDNDRRHFEHLRGAIGFAIANPGSTIEECSKK